MFFGRIISKSKKIPVCDFIELTSSVKIEPNFPTLIVGKTLVEELYEKNKIKVLNKRIEGEIFWTFGKTERRNDFEEDVKAFNKKIIAKIKSNIKYEYFNIFIEDKKTSIDFINWLYGNEEKYIAIVDYHLYIFNSKINKVIGFSLRDAEYIGKDIDSIIKKIKDNPNNIIIDNFDFLSQQTKVLLENDNILMPYLYYLLKN